MNRQFDKTAQRIREEFIQIEQVVDRVERAWMLFQDSSGDLLLDSVALNLHGFYNGLEILFETIATAIDETPLQGSRWHQTLLTQMTQSVPNVRPAVISAESRETLDSYRGFRHIVRHTYTLQFDVEQLQPLVEQLPEAFAQVRSELLAFAAFLENQA